jgi:hypothetical protein
VPHWLFAVFFIFCRSSLSTGDIASFNSRLLGSGGEIIYQLAVAELVRVLAF